MYSTDLGAFQHGVPKTALELLHDVVLGLKNRADLEAHITVEFVTDTPHTNVVGVVTAVGGKEEDILLTVEPVMQPSLAENTEQLVGHLRALVGDVLQPVVLQALAVGLLDRGVLPTRFC